MTASSILMPELKDLRFICSKHDIQPNPGYVSATHQRYIVTKRNSYTGCKIVLETRKQLLIACIYGTWIMLGLMLPFLFARIPRANSASTQIFHTAHAARVESSLACAIQSVAPQCRKQRSGET